MVRPGIELQGKRVLIVGMARTGIAVARFCATRGARVTAIDDRAADQVGEAVRELREIGCTLEFGGNHIPVFLSQDLIVPSPGVPSNHPGLMAARAARVTVWSEIELAWRFLRGRLVGVTGSNGKTTTTSLIAHILSSPGAAPGKQIILAGNIGSPLIAHVQESSDKTITVAELSSFQLELIDSFRPDVSVLLNLTPDHLDRHASFEEYARAKARIFENQMEADAAVINADDAAATRYAPPRPRTFWFSRQKRVASGAYLQSGSIVFRQEGEDIVLLERADIRLRGEHNVENALAAAAAAFLVGVAPGEIAAGVRSFPGVEHRLEFVAEIGGVSFFNDSKATNVDATMKALEAFVGGLFVILGGKDKGSDYAPLIPLLRERAKRALLIGSASEKIAAQLEGAVPWERAETLERAVAMAYKHARAGDTVLLAPACASFDQFENYEHRGRVFKQLVRALAEEPRAVHARGSEV
jgi:UDP-N-acetylmuramoylalanine--D-glutamate ligase